MSKKKHVRFKTEKEIIDRIDKYVAEINDIGANWDPEERRTRNALGYRRNRLEALKHCLAELRTPMLHPDEFGDKTVCEHAKAKIR